MSTRLAVTEFCKDSQTDRQMKCLMLEVETGPLSDWSIIEQIERARIDKPLLHE